MTHIFVVNMPDIGEGVVEGEIVQWLKQVGDPVSQDEPVVVVMTDKATVELPAPHPGKIVKQHYQVGQAAILGKPLYEIEGVEQLLATPAVRRLAKERGLDLQTIRGTGKDGRILETDLQQQKSGASNLDQGRPLQGVQKMMAKTMSQSKRSIPHFSFHEQADATALVCQRDRIKSAWEAKGIALSFMPFFLQTLSLTLEKYPEMNAHFNAETERLAVFEQHHIGIAMSSPAGLIVPVLKDVRGKSLEEIVHAYEELKAKALAGKLAPDEMKGSTITLSNYGAFPGKGLWATPIIHPPEVAILAVNRIQKQPVVREDRVVIREMLNLSWSFDHRIIDGKLAAEISSFLVGLLENPK